MQASEPPHEMNPPAPFRLTSALTLEMREGGGFLRALFGVPFFITGVWLALTKAGVLPSGGGPRSPLIHAAIALAFLTVGGCLLFGRRWFRVDLGRARVVRQIGLIFPLRGEERQLSEFEAVVLAYNPGDSESPVTWPVRLRALTGKDLPVIAPSNYAEARQQAEYLSRFLRLPMADLTTAHETVVSPERVSETLRERLLRGGVQIDDVAQPAGSRCEVIQASEGVTIIIRGGGSSFETAAFGLILPAFVLLFAGPVVLRSVLPLGRGHGVSLAFAMFLALFAVPVVYAAGRAAAMKRRRIIITASTAGLRIEERRAWRTRDTELPSSEIIDIDYAGAAVDLDRTAAKGIARALTSLLPTRGIVIKSRRELITIGDGLPASELRYLTAVLRRALAGSGSMPGAFR